MNARDRLMEDLKEMDSHMISVKRSDLVEMIKIYDEMKKKIDIEKRK